MVLVLVRDRDKVAEEDIVHDFDEVLVLDEVEDADEPKERDADEELVNDVDGLIDIVVVMVPVALFVVVDVRLAVLETEAVMGAVRDSVAAALLLGDLLGVDVSKADPDEVRLDELVALADG